MSTKKSLASAIMTFVNSCKSEGFQKPPRKETIEFLGTIMANMMMIETFKKNPNDMIHIMSGLAKEWTSDKEDQATLLKEANNWLNSEIEKNKTSQQA